ncbi:MAG TPA: hypothetical protein VLB27_02475 [candidate division Zixibacteria bacterium]|nr:hypothetical protein [candidate division Zixibacteria bacterium]
MTFRSDLFQAVGDWIEEACGLTEAKIQQANQVRSVKLAKPFLTMRLAAFDDPIGTDEVVDVNDAGTQRAVVRAWRRGTMVLSGYGAGADSYLISLAASAKLERTQDRFLAAGLAIRNFGQVLEVGGQVDGLIEQQFSRTLDIEYGMELTTGVEVVEATNYSVTITYVLYDGDPAPWVQTITGNTT